MDQVRIAVGSTNPVKVAAVESGFASLWAGQSIDAIGFAVNSGVSDQPMSSDETLAGARGRIAELRSQLEAGPFDFFAGIEGGIEIHEGQFFSSAWVVIQAADGREGRAKSGLFPLPPEVQRLVESGLELGHANDQVFQQHNSKQAGGAIGSLTGGQISRQALYEHAMALALIPFRHERLFAG